MVFMGIVGAFLVCHFLRIFLNFHEMFVIEEAMACSQAGKRSFNKWVIITNFFSHFLLVINSSINMLIYGILNSAFRAQLIKILKAWSTYLNCPKMGGMVPLVSNNDDGCTQAVNISPNKTPAIKAKNGQNGPSEGVQMVALDKGNSNGNALVTAEVETYLEGGVAKTANLDSSNKNLKSNVQVSHV